MAQDQRRGHRGPTWVERELEERLYIVNATKEKRRCEERKELGAKVVTGKEEEAKIEGHEGWILYCLVASSNLICAIAFPGLSPFGHVLEQLKMV